MSPEAIWYGQGTAARLMSALLAPLGWLYCGVATMRRAAYQRGWLGSESVGVPVIIVGNLTVGGTGKTPLVLWLAGYLRAQGLRPGVAIRGYRGLGGLGARLVPANGDPRLFGDEPLLLAARADCPVVVGRDRVAAARLLVTEHGCNAVVTDDGLQHYRLRRDYEVLVVDGMRRFGNSRCLPAGPLREPPGRAGRVDLTIVNVGAAVGGDGGSAAESGASAAAVAGGSPMRMLLLPDDAVNLHDGRRRPLAAFRDETVTAIAGIGNPGRFFSMLRRYGLQIVERAFPDHHRFTAKDLSRLPRGPVLMTEKDAVKCRAWANRAHWYVPVRAQPDAAFVAGLDPIIEACRARP